MLRKLEKDKGSALIFVLALLMIITTITFVLYRYSINQTKQTKKTQDSMKQKYINTGKIESGIAEYISNIELSIKNEEIFLNLKNKVPYKFSLDNLNENLNLMLIGSPKISVSDRDISVPKIYYFIDNDIKGKQEAGRGKSITILLNLQVISENSGLKEDRYLKVEFKDIKILSEVLTYDINYSLLDLN